jgi:hypothetical protein
LGKSKKFSVSLFTSQRGRFKNTELGQVKAIKKADYDGRTINSFTPKLNLLDRSIDETLDEGNAKNSRNINEELMAQSSGAKD